MGVSERAPLQSTAPKIWEASNQNGQTLGQVILAQVVEGGADIDISGLEFDFVRSIRVWDVRHDSHRERGRDDGCSESHNMRLGTYGMQGKFGWQRATPEAAPKWVQPSRRCSSSNWRRGVGVEWEDHEGNHGYEWVAYQGYPPMSFMRSAISSAMRSYRAACLSLGVPGFGFLRRMRLASQKSNRAAGSSSFSGTGAG